MLAGTIPLREPKEEMVFGKHLLRNLRSLLRLSRRAALIARRSPAAWFPTAVHMSRLQWGFYRLLWWRPDILLRTSVLLDVYLYELNKLGRFPIPWNAVGTEHLRRGVPDSERDSAEGDADGRHFGGTLYCAAHLPLFSAHARVLDELGAAPSLVIALADAINKEGGYPLPGLGKSIPAFAPRTSTLAKVHRALLSGATVGSMIDAYPGGPLKPQLFRLAGKTGSRIVFLFSELDRRGHMKFTIAMPPHPVPDTEEKVQANLVAYDTERKRILAHYRGDHPASQPRSA